jgi:hypothetical protein
MTPPPPALPGPRTGNREMRRRAPVSDRPGAGLVAAGSSLPLQGVVLSVALPPAQFFAGLDWAAEVHAVCVMNHAGKIAGRFTVKHSADGIAMLIRRLAKLAGAGDVQVGIERPNGRLVDLLLEAGHPVVPVSPNAMHMPAPQLNKDEQRYWKLRSVLAIAREGIWILWELFGPRPR